MKSSFDVGYLDGVHLRFTFCGENVRRDVPVATKAGGVETREQITRRGLYIDTDDGEYNHVLRMTVAQAKEFADWLAQNIEKVESAER